MLRTRLPQDQQEFAAVTALGRQQARAAADGADADETVNIEA